MPPTKEPGPAVTDPGMATGPGHDNSDATSTSIAREPDRDMADALEQARARWGSSALVAETRILDGEDRTVTVRHVGRLGHDSYSWHEIGRGRSWRAAFDAADRAEGMVRR